MDARKKRIIGWVSVLGLLLLCLIGYLLLSRNQVYRNVTYSVCYHSDTLVTAADLKAYANAHCPKVKGRLKREVSLPQLEKKLRRWPYADSVRIATDMKGVMHIEVVQVRTVLRVFNEKGASFYLAKTGRSGRMLPCVPGRPVRVPVASGAIPDICRPNLALEWQDTSVCHDLMILADYIDRSPFWRAQISQIHVLGKGRYQLAPTVGNHLVDLGDVSQLDRKFNNLWKVYSQGFNVTGWQRYRKVGLQFGDRVPCEKRTI
ncbi:MAG: hypothetical protein J5873_04620 [Bacteroidales bacterium]|nr:hypothetical protein [Bacteroidales bacterium]